MDLSNQFFHTHSLYLHNLEEGFKAWLAPIIGIDYAEAYAEFSSKPYRLLSLLKHFSDSIYRFIHLFQKTLYLRVQRYEKKWYIKKWNEILFSHFSKYLNEYRREAFISVVLWTLPLSIVYLLTICSNKSSLCVIMLCAILLYAILGIFPLFAFRNIFTSPLSNKKTQQIL